MAYRVTIQKNGRVVLPVAFRRELGLESGQPHEILLEVVDGRGVMETPLDRMERLRSRFRKLKGFETGLETLKTSRRDELRDEASLTESAASRD